MKLDYRDVIWSVAALVLLCLLGLEWRRSYLIAEEIRARSIAEPPLELLNAELQDAAFFMESLYRAQCRYDWPSLQPLGLKPRTLITRTIQADTAKQAFEQLFGERVEVVEDLELQAMGRSLRVRARQGP